VQVGRGYARRDVAQAPGMLEAIRNEGQQADPLLERAIGIDEEL
jgi:hypothetical protein